VERLEAVMPVREEALLVTSELASNAVRHSGSRSGDEIELKAELVPEGVRIAVTDTGRSNSEPAVRAGDQNGPGGFGLRVVQALGRRWGARRNGGLCVWVELPL
jgi:anti-sigma regulatory factor (Ser/Thr protein kinase)